MRYLLLLAIVLVSLCTGLPNIPFINPGNTTAPTLGTLMIGCPDLSVSVQVTPTEVKSGRDINLLFDLENINSHSLKNVNLTLYDPCIFTGDEGKFVAELKANRSLIFSLKLTAGDTNMDTNCNLKFRVTYDAESSMFQDVVVLTKSEYDQRDVSGTLNSIPIQSSFPSSPLKISLAFSDKQPFIENEKYYMYLDYYNIGSGVLEVNSGGITMNAPENMRGFECKDYTYDSSALCKDIEACLKVTGIDYAHCETGAMSCTWIDEESTCKNQLGCSWTGTICQGSSTSCSGISDAQTCNNQIGCTWSNLYLNKALNFIGGRASSSTCSFTTTASQPMDIKSLSITSRYKYILDSSISIRVRKA